MMTLEKHVLGTLKPSGAKVATENCYVTQSASTLLESLPYYYGCISREDAEWILYDEGCPDGMYLLRESGTDLVLSLCHHSSVLHYRINRLPSGDVVLSGLPQQTFASPMELIDTVDGLACKPIKPVKALFGKCLPPTHWGLAEEHIREQLIGRAADYGLTADQLAEALDCDLHFSTHFPPLVRSLIFKSLHEIQPWYHFRLSRTDAERRLEASGHQDGKFLVRERDESSYAICLSHESRVKHYRIDILPSGNFAIQDGPKFESIIALISHYTIFSGGLWCMLGEGCPRPQDLVRQYAEQSSAQLLQSSAAAGTGHSHHHHHTHLALATSCRIESTHNHTAHQRSRSIDRYHRSSADLLVPAKQCKQCLQAVLSVHAANRVRVRRVSTPTNVKLKEWFTTINHKWARIKRQVILHHQRQQPLINEDNYGSTTYGTSEEISCCHVTSGNAGTVKRVPASTRKASKVTANLSDLLVDGTGHYHHCDHLHLPCSGAINYRYSNGYGTYGHRRQQFGRWHEEPTFGSRYAFDAENCDPNGAVNGTSSEQPVKGNPTSNSVTGTPNGKSAAGNNKNLNGFNHFDFHDENDNHIPEICPALIKSSSIDTIAAITDPIEEIRRLHLHQAHSPLPASICRNSIQTRDGTILQLDPTYRSFQSVLHPAAAAAKLHLQRTNSFDGVATTTNGAHCNCNCGDWLLDLNGDENDPFGSIMNTDEEGGGGGGGSDGEKPNEDKTLEELANIFTRAHQTQPLPPLLNGFSSPPNSTTSPVPLKETNNNNNNASSKPHLNGNSVTASHCNGLTQPANGFKTLPHLHNGLRAKALAVQKCSTSSSSGGTDSGSGSSGSCGPSGSSCKSNSSTGSGGPSSVYPTGFTSHHRSFSQATTVTMHNTMTLGRLPFRENNTPTLMDTTTSEAAEADSQPESITSLADIFEPTSTASGGKGGGGTAPIIDLLKEFDVCFNSAEHIDDDSSTLTDNSTHSFGSPHRRHCPAVNGFPSPPPATVDSLLSSPPSCTLPGQQVSTVPPPTLPPPPPPGSSGLSGSGSGCSTSLPSSQCAQGAAAASSCSSTTPCKASPTPVPYGRETNDGQSNGLSGPSAADEQDIAVACTPTTADKLKDIELICLNEEPEEVQETIKKYRRGPICFDPRCISLRRRIGNGYFGDVFLATIPSSTHAISLAVKMLKSHAVPQQKAEILREAQTMAKLDHRHIVRLIGVCEGDPFMLVMELAPLGPLNKYLQNYGQNLTEEDILRLMHQVAKAMQYLEEMNCVHRDLAARNILLVSEKFAKVSDFGMSRALGQGKDYYKARSASKWPLKWYAPECIYYYKFSSKSDVWSYGIALWEALSRGEMPYQGMDGQDILKMFAENRRLAKPDKCPVAIYQLMWSCWQFKPEDRLNFAAINDQLTHHLAGK